MKSFKIKTICSSGGRDTNNIVVISTSLKNHNSPLLRALHALEELTSRVPKQDAHTRRLKRGISFIERPLKETLNIGSFYHNENSFEDLLYSIDHEIEKQELSSAAKSSISSHIRALFKLSRVVMGDGKPISVCLKNYIPFFTNKRESSRTKTVLDDISTISHQDITELEKKAKNITQSFLSGLSSACSKDIDEYLKLCEYHEKLACRKLSKYKRKQIEPFFLSLNISISN